MGIIEFDIKSQVDKIANMTHLLQKGKNEQKVGGKIRWREKVFLLSRNTRNRTVGFRRSKKGKRSTRSRLRVDPGFASF